MLKTKTAVLLLAMACAKIGLALEADEILVVANTDYPASVRLARYYCEKRGVPAGNVIPVSLGASLRDSLSRSDYNKRLVGPIRRIFMTRKDLEKIQCLVTTYGIPLSVGRRPPLVELEGRLQEFDGLLIPPVARTLAELEKRQSKPLPKRGRK